MSLWKTTKSALACLIKVCPLHQRNFQPEQSCLLVTFIYRKIVAFSRSVRRFASVTPRIPDQNKLGGIFLENKFVLKYSSVMAEAGPGFVGIRFCEVTLVVPLCCPFNQGALFQGMQQYVVSQRRQSQQSTALRVPKLRLQANRRQQLHLREQNHARS